MPVNIRGLAAGAIGAQNESVKRLLIDYWRMGSFEVLVRVSVFFGTSGMVTLKV